MVVPSTGVSSGQPAVSVWLCASLQRVAIEFVWYTCLGVLQTSLCIDLAVDRYECTSFHCALTPVPPASRLAYVICEFAHSEISNPALILCSSLHCIGERSKMNGTQRREGIHHNDGDQQNAVADRSCIALLAQWRDCHSFAPFERER
jgi:hypothetical protein